MNAKPENTESGSSFKEGQEMMRTTWERGENGTSQVGKTENGKWINGEFSPDEE